MMIAHLQHHRVMMLLNEVTKFRNSFGTESPSTKALDVFLTYLELLAMWQEEANPWQRAVLLAQQKAEGAAVRYLAKAIEKVEAAELEDILAVIEVENDRLRKEVHTALIVDRDRIARIEELLEENEDLSRINKDLIEEAKEHERRIEDLENNLSEAVEQLKDANDALSELNRKRI